MMTKTTTLATDAVVLYSMNGEQAERMPRSPHRIWPSPPRTTTRKGVHQVRHSGVGARRTDQCQRDARDARQPEPTKGGDVPVVRLEMPLVSARSRCCDGSDPAACRGVASRRPPRTEATAGTMMKMRVAGTTAPGCRTNRRGHPGASTYTAGARRCRGRAVATSPTPKVTSKVSAVCRPHPLDERHLQQHPSGRRR